MHVDLMDGEIRVRIEPSTAAFAVGLATELVVLGLILWGVKAMLTTYPTTLERVSIGILLLTLSPLLIIQFPGWYWMMHEVLTLGQDTLQLRRQLWRISRTSAFELGSVRNFRFKPSVDVRGFYRNTIEFDHDLELGVHHAFGKDLDPVEAQNLVRAIEQWRKSTPKF